MGIVIRQSIKGTIMNYLGVVVGFITTFFVMTKYLTQEEIGLTRVMADAAILLSGLASLGTNTSALRYYPYFRDRDSRDHGFFGWTLIIPMIGFIIITILFFFFKDERTRIKSTIENFPAFLAVPINARVNSCLKSNFPLADG